MDDSVEKTALGAIENEEPGFALLGGEAEVSPRPQASNYQVLARKYRPSDFSDLVGQEAMVRTLSNAFESGRIAHAFMLTGVRGVGKTTTARILARALNYEAPGVTGSTIQMDKPGLHCDAIMESRHVDVMEMDAASRTGIDDIREIIESVRYAPVSARYKVYIIDEVHMLSKAAFNGLLKTLEEPPPHVKFIFATTEIRKVPVTVLSRCQRFDLRRLSVDELSGLLARVSQKEGVAVEDAALKLLARAADGSARDGLSLLDRAIAHSTNEGNGDIVEASIRDMLGLADRARIFDLFDLLMQGDIAGALGELRAQYDVGADPTVVLSDLADLTHWLTRLKLVESSADDLAMSETERVRGQDMAVKLPIRVLSRVWQMLLKGILEVQGAARPIAAAEMVLVRIAYVSDGPSPEELLEQLKSGDAVTRKAPIGSAPAPSGGGPRAQLRTVSTTDAIARQPAAAPAVSAAPAAQFARFEDVVAWFGTQRDIRMKSTLEASVRLVRFEVGHIEIQLLDGTSGDIARELSEKLTRASGRRWVVSLATARPDAAPTLKEQKQSSEDALKASAEADPLVQATLAAFPGAKIVEVRDPLAMPPLDLDDHDLPPDDEMELDE